MGPTDQIRFLLANLILGNIPEIDFITREFNFGENLMNILEATTTNKPEVVLMCLRNLMLKLNVELKLGLPAKALELFNAFFYYMKGEGGISAFYDPYFNERLLKAKEGDKPNPINAYKFLGRFFDIFP